MSAGPSFWEFLLLCAIGLIVLGPKRLPQVAQQIGTWVGQARRMTRTLRRQLEEELELDKPLNIRPPVKQSTPRDDDTYSPLHESTVPPPVTPPPVVPTTTADAASETDDAPRAVETSEAEAGNDGEQRQNA